LGACTLLSGVLTLRLMQIHLASQPLRALVAQAAT
jgi:hypothetical protein